MHDLTIAQAIRAHIAHARRHPEDTGRALQALDDLAADLYDGPTIKACACGALYDAAGWTELEIVGVSDDGIERVEWRNCPCHSTLGVVLGPSTAACVDASALPVHANSQVTARDRPGRQETTMQETTTKDRRQGRGDARRLSRLGRGIGDVGDTRAALARCVRAACADYQEVLELLEGGGSPSRRITRKVERNLRAAVMLLGCLKDGMRELETLVPAVDPGALAALDQALAPAE